MDALGRVRLHGHRRCAPALGALRERAFPAVLRREADDTIRMAVGGDGRRLTAARKENGSMTAPTPLHGQVALVAGNTRGAGRGIARALGEAGATVYCTGRSVRGNRDLHGEGSTEVGRPALWSE